MRAHSMLTRRLLASTVPVALLLGLGTSPARTDPLIGNVLNSYGLPGGVETPTAEMLPDGTLGGTVSYNELGRRHNVVFQLHPRITTALRYSRVEGMTDHNELDHIWDRSFDIRFQVLDEAGWRPAVAVGLQDFMGTGVYSGEYIVASKSITPRLRASLGIGWGRLAGEYRRPDADDQGGKPNIDEWFSGSPKPFGSIAWQVNDKLSLVAEYSSDEYVPETRRGTEEAPGSQFNLGAYYTFNPQYQLGLYTLGGDTFGAQFSFALNPRNAPFPSGLEKAPAPVKPRPAPAADPEGWSGAWSADPTAQPAIQTALADALADEGQILESMALSSNRAELRIRNNKRTPAQILELLSEKSVAPLRALVEGRDAVWGRTEQFDTGPLAEGPKLNEHTTSFSAMDAEGNAVCLTQSLCSPWGSCVVLPGSVVFLNFFVLCGGL